MDLKLKPIPSPGNFARVFSIVIYARTVYILIQYDDNLFKNLILNLAQDIIAIFDNEHPMWLIQLRGSHGTRSEIECQVSNQRNGFHGEVLHTIGD